MDDVLYLGDRREQAGPEDLEIVVLDAETEFDSEKVQLKIKYIAKIKQRGNEGI